MLASPVSLLVDFDIGDRRVEVIAQAHRHREPERAVRGLDAIAVGEAVALELHGIEKDEQVAAGDAVEIAEPGQVGGLVDGDNHVNAKGGRATAHRPR
jgi:hypothetical protein